MGRHISNLLLDNTNVNLILSGRDLKKLSELNSDRVSTAYIDVTECEKYIDIFNSVDIVINATPTIKHQSKLKDTILKSKCDFFDIHAPSKDNYAVFNDCKNIEGQTIVLDCGATSFLPFLKLAKLPFKKVDIVSHYKVIWNNHLYTKDTEIEHEEILNGNLTEECVYKDSKWYLESDQLVKDFDVGQGIGMLNGETKIALSSYNDIEEIGYYVVFETHDAIEEEHTCLNINTCNETIKVIHKDGWYFAAVFAVSGIMQYLETKKEGLFHLGEYVEHKKFCSQIEALGLRIEIKERT